MATTNPPRKQLRPSSLWLLALVLSISNTVSASDLAMPDELRAAGVAKDFEAVDRILSRMWEEKWHLNPPDWIPFSDSFRDGSEGEVGEPPRDIFGDLEWASQSPNATVAISRYEALYEKFYDKETGDIMAGDSIDFRYYTQVRLQLMRLYFLKDRPAMAETVYEEP